MVIVDHPTRGSRFDSLELLGQYSNRASIQDSDTLAKWSYNTLTKLGVFSPLTSSSSVLVQAYGYMVQGVVEISLDTKVPKLKLAIIDNYQDLTAPAEKYKEGYGRRFRFKGRRRGRYTAGDQHCGAIYIDFASNI